MKIRNILLGLVYATSVISAAHTQQQGQQQQASNTVVITGDDALGMFHYFSKRYFPLIEDLREGRHVSRDEILRAYSDDQFLDRHHNGGSASFTHKVLPLKFGITAHGTTDIIGPNERKEHHRILQVYVNVIKLFIQEVVNPREALNALDSMPQPAWASTYGAKLNKAAVKFNQTTREEWGARIKIEEAAFDEYSREKK